MEKKYPIGIEPNISKHQDIILKVCKAHGVKSLELTTKHIALMSDCISEYIAQQTTPQGIGWVKGVKGFPIRKKVIAKFKHYDDPLRDWVIGTASSATRDMICFDWHVSSIVLDINHERWNMLEWLDESHPQPVEDWISVDDKLPTEGGRYWCYVEEITDLGISHFQWNCAYNEKEKRWSDNFISTNVTHWRLLPEPPKRKP